MSSSKVLAAAQVTPERVPIGSHEFIARFRREQEENSPLGQRLRQLEEQHQLALDQTRQTAYAQGEAAGLQTGLAEARRIESELRGAINALSAYRQTLLRQYSEQALELAFALADKITAARGESERQVVIDTINRAIAEIHDTTKIQIRVNPAQVELVRSQLAEVKSASDSTTHIQVEPDERVSPGGCIIETDSGSADARLETQLQALRNRLQELQS